MADDKKGDKKGGDKKKEGGGGGGSLGPFEVVIALFVVFTIGSFIALRLKAFIGSPTAGITSTRFDSVIMFFVSLKPYAIAFSYFVSGLFLAMTVYSTIRLTAVNKALNALYYPTIKPAEPEVTNARWQRVLKHIESDNEQEWKLAVIEADVMLDELLDKLNYHGDTMADKLKQVEKGDFATIDLAWEGHKVRNAIAHEGGEFLLSQREARRIIDLYRQVFNEFYFI